MKKVININFHGRVIPIEETAFDLLKQYTESLRRYFANEEGRDEIINDIEGRIAELFSDRLKKGAVCITDEDVNVIIDGMGRPEDLEAAEADLFNAGAGTQSQSAGAGPNQSAGYQGAGASGSASSSASSSASGQGSYGSGNYGGSAGFSRGNLYRNADDKILGGVCSGLANYLGIDPVIMRIIFVLLSGALFWVYVLLWIIVPSRSLSSNITKRLYRNPDDKVIAGVAGGLAVYFNIASWIPRLIFALPLILGAVGSGFNAMFWDWDIMWGPRVISGGLGSTMFVVYLVLWIAVPFATTAAEKLEMKGERIDLNSIRDTVKGDLESFKSRAQSWGAEVKQTAQQFSAKSKVFAEEVAPVARRTGSGLGYVIGILFKAFFLFIAAIIAISLFAALMAILFSGVAILPLKDFILEGFWQNTLAWSVLILFLGVPAIALITWLVRRIMGVKSTNNYLGYIFGGLWTIGFFSLIFLGGLMARNFKTRAGIENAIPLTQPSNDKLFIQSVGKESRIRYYNDDWFGIDWGKDAPFYGVNRDSMMLKTVRVNVVKSADSSFHVYTVKFSRSSNSRTARTLAEHIEFPVAQQDSILNLPKGFIISADDKFRNQQVLVIVEVPIGKRIELDRSLNDYNWFNVQTTRKRGWVQVEWNNEWDETYKWRSNVEYIMTRDGLKRTGDYSESELKEGRFKFKIDEKGVIIEGEGELKDSNKGYEYKGPDKNRKSKREDREVAIEASISRLDREEDGRLFDSPIKSFPGLNGTAIDGSPLVILTSLLR
ncbi:MAG TPA: PspC domain-containing protein [Flavihumibacter sp.]